MSKKSAPHARKRTAAVLSSRVEKRLIAYVAVASAAGVGALASPSAAEAKVVYTPTWTSFVPKQGPIAIDLNNDGIADVQLSTLIKTVSSRSGYRTTTVKLDISPQGSNNQVWASNGFALALPAGVKLDGTGKFKTGQQVMASESYDRAVEGYPSSYRQVSGGPWKQATRLFVGVKFIIKNEVHYGWIRLNVMASNGGMYGAINGYAYESVANKPILTGQTSGNLQERTLGRLAVGAAGVGSSGVKNEDGN